MTLAPEDESMMLATIRMVPEHLQDATSTGLQFNCEQA
jgi:hypothetical protein